MSEKSFRVEIPVNIKRVPPTWKRPATDKSQNEDESVPRLARLLALAHKWERMVRRGEKQGYAELARLTGLTRGRLTQVCSLTLLAPDIQEVILDQAIDVFPERVLRRVVRHASWEDQQAHWPTGTKRPALR